MKVASRNAWFDKLDARQQKEVWFAESYHTSFSHGTDGHNRLLLIALMARLLDEIHEAYSNDV